MTARAGHAGIAAATVSSAQLWFVIAIGSLVLAGLLSLTLVLGRLPFLAPLFTDPLFFKRALVVHVDLSLVVWFQAGTAAFGAWLAGDRLPRGLSLAARILAAAGLAGMLAGALMPGAQPILANYVPVIDHPVFLAGLACWLAGSGLHFAALLGTPASGNAPDDALIALRASAAANLLALATFSIAWTTTLAGLPAIGYYELVAWGGGHLLQVANTCTLLGLWLFLSHRHTGSGVLSPSASRWLFTALVAPHAALPLLALGGTSATAYTETATMLMRWTIFPVVLVVLGLGIRHFALNRAASDHRIAGLGGSVALILLGFVLGACIRGSSTLVPGHYHAAIGAVTLALMTAAYDFCGAFAPAEAAAATLRRARFQLILFGCGQAVFALGFSLAGIYGLGRKQYASEQHVRSLGEYVGLGVMGTGGLLAVGGGLLFLAVMLRCIGSWRHRIPQPAEIHP